MGKSYAIKITVEKILEGGLCPFGLREGDSFIIKDVKIPKDFCSWAFQSIYPFITALRFGGEFPWEEKGVSRVCCPDPNNPVVFTLKRVKLKPRQRDS